VTRDELEALREAIQRALQPLCGSQALHDFIDGKSDLDGRVGRMAAELGWLAVGLPPTHGGLGLSHAGLAIVHEELGRRLAPGPFIATLSAAQWLAQLDESAVVSRLVAALVAGETTAAVPAVPQGGALEFRGGRVRGAIQVLGSADAGLAIAPLGREGWAILETTGPVAFARTDAWDRTRQICTLDCQDATPLAVIPDPDGALGLALRRLLALAIAADSLGGAAAVAAQTVGYAKTRMQFGQPIGGFQALKHRMANHVLRIASARHLIAQAVEAAGRNDPDADLWAALAKAEATDAFAFVAGDCIQLHGGVGHTWAFDIHIFAKRARLNQALLADNRSLLDAAADGLAAAVRAGRNSTELVL